MKVFLTGGGTLGSVSPLIGIYQKLKEKDNNLVTFFIGTKSGPEKEFVKQYCVKYESIVSTKYRRYSSLKSFLIPGLLFISFWQSLFLLIKHKPDWIIGAGSFVQVPLIWASKFFKTKVVLYQSDLKKGLANKLNEKQADLIFVTFPESKKYFKNLNKVQVVGTVLRSEINEVNNNEENILLVLGGGTGATSINNLIKESICELTKDFKVIHVTGQGKKLDFKHDNYEQYEILLDDYYEKLNQAKLIISRAGLSSIMELSYLAKNSILIPLPRSSQVDNAKYICFKKGAVCLEQDELNSNKLIKAVKRNINLGNEFNKIFKHQGEIIIADTIYEFKRN